MTVEDIFMAAVEKPSAERAAYLDAACRHDAGLRASAEALLRAHEEAGSLLEQPLFRTAPTVDLPPVTEGPGTVVGPYKLLEQIGEGGFGVVYMAEQTQPVRRKVALKVLKPGMDTRQVVARFEAERQALAIMDHPNIARVFDGGATDSGRPFFVMELVKGVPITEFCDRNHLTPRRRLELFVSVCQAVQHAHQKGIIHRDIKPTNVLVTVHDTTPVVKVIDFGVAKALGQELTEKTLFTGFAQMIGTPLYMSPEQAGQSGLDMDTRSDIYSLGVLLYELLTGTTPFDKGRFQKAAYDEIRRIIREEEPPKPSIRLSELGRSSDPTRTGPTDPPSSLASVSASRHTEPAKLTKLFRGEVDWIVMKALEKDRNRRYETANGFVADVQRYLADEPVQACPPTVGYRFRKFTRRNKRALASATVLILAVLAVAGTIGWALRDREANVQQLAHERESQAQDAARERAARAAKVDQEVNAALKEAAQWLSQEKWPEALSAVKRAEGLLTGGGSAELRDRVHQFRKDLEMVLRLEEIRLLSTEVKDGYFDFESADKAYTRAFAEYGLDVFVLPVEESVARIRAHASVAVPLIAALDDWTNAHSWKDPAGRSRLTAIAQAADPDSWRRQVRQAVQQKDAKGLAALANSPDLPRQPPASVLVLAIALRSHGLPDVQIAVLRQAQRQYPGDFWLNYSLAWQLRTIASPTSESLGEAVSFARAALAVRPLSSAVHTLLGICLRHQKKSAEAIACYKKAIELDPKYADPHNDLGLALADQGELVEAVVCFNKAVELDPKYARYRYNLAKALNNIQGKRDEAIVAYRETIRLDPKYVDAHINLGIALANQGKMGEAIDCYSQAIALNPDVANAWRNRGIAYRDLKQYEKALTDLSRAIELKPDDASMWFNRGLVYRALKQADESLADLSRAIELKPDHADAWYNRGSVYCDIKQQYEKALGDLSRAIELNPSHDAARHNRGVAYRNLKQYEKALTDLSAAIELNPAYDSAWVIRHQVYRSLKQWDRAVADYSEFLRLKPDHFLALVARTSAYENLQQWDKAIADRTRIMELRPKDFTLRNDLAERLAACPDPKFRNATRAVELAKVCVEAEPNNGNYWNTLGAAHYFAGDRKAALTALHKSMDLKKGGDGYDWIVLAMAHWPDDKVEARKWYDRAVVWMDKNPQPRNEDLRRFRAEAAELLGVVGKVEVAPFPRVKP